MHRTLAATLLAVLALATLPAPATAGHTACGGTGIWLGPATGSDCVGFYTYLLDPSFICVQGVGHTSVPPVTVHVLRGGACPLGVVVNLP